MKGRRFIRLCTMEHIYAKVRCLVGQTQWQSSMKASSLSVPTTPIAHARAHNNCTRTNHTNDIFHMIILISCFQLLPDCSLQPHQLFIWNSERQPSKQCTFSVLLSRFCCSFFHTVGRDMLRQTTIYWGGSWTRREEARTSNTAAIVLSYRVLCFRLMRRQRIGLRKWQKTGSFNKRKHFLNIAHLGIIVFLIFLFLVHQVI